MNLYLLRHGVAEPRAAAQAGRDAQRPLTPKGKRKLQKAARGMKAMGLSFDLILSSPYVRAWQTAEAVAAVFQARQPLQECAALKPGGSFQKLIDLLQRSAPPAAEVLLVGHEPYLSELIGMLLAGESSLAVPLKKGGLCKLSAEVLQPGRCASLEWLLTPKQLRRMRKR